MYIGTYGTLMQGQSRHHVLDTSTFLGRYRARQFDVLLLQTPAGFPAWVTADANYIEELVTESAEWWENYVEEHLETVDPEPRTGWGSGLDVPLLEIYSISDTVCDRLDIIEGVPNLYQRVVANTIAVEKDRVSVMESLREWRKLLLDDSSSFSDAMKLSPDYISDTGRIKRCNIYSIPANDDWIQGSSIIWNGDFNNPLIRDGINYEYNKWNEEREKRHKVRMEEVRNRGRVRVRTPTVAQQFRWVDNTLAEVAPDEEVVGAVTAGTTWAFDNE